MNALHNNKTVDQAWQKGFSLVELSIVLVIVAIALVGLLAPTSEQRAVNKQKQSQSLVLDLKSQLLQFAVINKYLPCPDTDDDGLENRTAGVCDQSWGRAPYLTLGIDQTAAQDAWGGFIRYAINTQAADSVSVVVCDPTSSASYFCMAAPGTARFTLLDTPPIMNNLGAGNYTVCNNTVASCSGTPASSALAHQAASVVLVAYNQDGVNTLANCGSASGATAENCDTDEYYHQATKTKGDDSGVGFFDDVIEVISGYEIKAKVLSSTLNWTSFTGGSSMPNATYESFDLSAGDYTPLDDANTPDVIVVNRNITTALDLGAGNDYVVVGNDLSSGLVYNNVTGVKSDLGTQATLNAGAGNDIVYIVGKAQSSVYLGDGDDTFVLGSNLIKTVDGGTGNDKVWIQGNINSNSALILGNGDDIVWLGDASNSSTGILYDDIDGGAGYDIVVLENTASWSSLTTTKKTIY